MVQYTYDSWGKLISTTGTLASTLGANNPFRYRGYYYDAETGLYYPRYYDPEVCRFISADVYMSTGQGVVGNNMFVYCLNNLTLYTDNNGEFAILGPVLAGVAAVVVAGVFGGLSSLVSGEPFHVGFFSGATTAAITVAAVGITVASGGTAGAVIAAGAMAGAAGGVAGYGVESCLTKKESNAGEAGLRAIVSGMSGALSGGFTAITGSAGCGVMNAVVDAATSYVGALHIEAIFFLVPTIIKKVEQSKRVKRIAGLCNVTQYRECLY